MYCPKCGDEMVTQGGEVFCRRGRMGLARVVENRLTECFVANTATPSDKAFAFRIGGTWFCPGCGVQDVEEAGVIRCPRCHRSLNEFVHNLIEQHPHLMEDGSWR